MKLKTGVSIINSPVGQGKTQALANLLKYNSKVYIAIPNSAVVQQLSGRFSRILHPYKHVVEKILEQKPLLPLLLGIDLFLDELISKKLNAE